MLTLAHTSAALNFSSHRVNNLGSLFIVLDTKTPRDGSHAAHSEVSLQPSFHILLNDVSQVKYHPKYM